MAPLIRLLKKEIGGHADPQHLATFDLVATLPIPVQRVSRLMLVTIDHRTIAATLRIQGVHITELAAFTDLAATMPRIPDIVHPIPNNEAAIRDEFHRGWRRLIHGLARRLDPSGIQCRDARDVNIARQLLRQARHQLSKMGRLLVRGQRRIIGIAFQ